MHNASYTEKKKKKILYGVKNIFRLISFPFNFFSFLLFKKTNNQLFTMADQEVLVLRGTLEGHNGWVTSLATTPAHPDLLLSGSRDKTLIKWKLTGGEDNQYGIPKKSFKGHSHIVQDVTISADGAYALSASWDRTLRLWDLETGETTQRFVGHKGDVLSVSIAKNLRQIVSASRDKTVKVWNTIGECMATLTGHNDWVSAVRISPSDQSSTVISASWDKTVKVCYSLFVLFFSFIVIYYCDDFLLYLLLQTLLASFE